MKLFMVLLCLGALPALAVPVHPHVYATAQDRAHLRAKAANVDWAREIVRRWHREVDPMVARYAADPESVIGRLQMHWEEGKRYTRFYADRSRNVIPRREGNAEYPTVRVAYARVWGTGVRDGDYFDNPLYSDGRLHAKNPDDAPPDGLIPFERTGQAAELINERMLRLAYEAAVLNWLEPDPQEAAFAADVFWTIVRGGAQQEEIDPDQTDGNMGLLSYETLGDTRRYWTLPLIWDFLYDYFQNAYFTGERFRNGTGKLWSLPHPQGREWANRQVEVFFKKMIENKLNRGGGLIGNWNLNEQQSAMLYALALETDASYADRRGQKYYVRKLVKGPTTPTHGAYMDVLRANIDPVSGLWPEAPGGYGQGSIAQLVKFGFIYWKNGLDLLGRDPLLYKASRATMDMLHPNGWIANVGDSSYHRMWPDELELLMTYAQAKGDTAVARQCAGLLRFLGKREAKDDIAFFFYLDAIPEAPTPALSRAFYAPIFPTVMERSVSPSGDVRDALSFALSGASPKMGHRHANGLTLELTGRGEVTAPDPGAGGDYWSRETHEYYRNVAGHNTVTPNGCGADDNHPEAFTILASDPAFLPTGGVARAQHPSRPYVTVAGEFKVGDLVAPQQRTVAIIRTSRTQGYYLDIVRSRVSQGDEKYHDYIFHLLGEWVTGTEASPQSLDPSSGKGYDYFTPLAAYDALDGWQGTVKYCEDNVTRVFLPAVAKTDAHARPRTLYRLEAPKAFRHYDRRVSEKPCPAFIVRQEGEAWNHPFVAVYEPAESEAKGLIAGVSARALPHGDLEVTVTYRTGSRRNVIIQRADGRLVVK